MLDNSRGIDDNVAADPGAAVDHGAGQHNCALADGYITGNGCPGVDDFGKLNLTAA